MGTNLSSSAIMLGRALEDPEKGLTALTRTGTVFTDAQKDMVKQLVETGKLQEAQVLILKELEAQYGGTAEAAAKGYAGALDTLAQRQQEFLLAINDTLGVTDILATAVNGLADVFNVLAENMKRVVTYIATAAVAGMIAFRGAILKAASSITALLIPSLTALRVAIGLTGVGLLVVAAGELWYRFGQLREKAGSFTEALGLLADAGREVFGNLGKATELLGALMQAAWAGMKSTFLSAIESMLRSFQGFITNVTEGLNRVFNLDLEPPTIPGLSEIVPGGPGGEFTIQTGIIPTAAAEAEALYDSLSDKARGLADDLTDSLPALRQIRELFAKEQESGDNAARLPEFKPDDPLAGGGGGGKVTDYTPQLEALRNYFKTREEILIEEYAKEREMLRAALHAGQIADQEEFQELSLASAARYQERMAALEREKNQQRLQNTASVFGALAQVASSAGEGMAKAAAIFGGIEAVINAYVAASQALADPTKVTPAQKFAGYASVLAAGLGAVKAIKAAGAKVGGGGGGGGAASGARSAPPQVSRNVAIQLTGGDMYSRDQVIRLINGINEAVEDGAVVRLV